jgi:hypothetical protein
VVHLWSLSIITGALICIALAVLNQLVPYAVQFPSYVKFHDDFELVLELRKVKSKLESYGTIPETQPKSLAFTNVYLLKKDKSYTFLVSPSAQPSSIYGQSQVLSQLIVLRENTDPYMCN